MNPRIAERRVANARGTHDHRPEPAAIRALQKWGTCPSFGAGQALALSRECRGDWRPEALLWHFGQDESGAGLIAYHLATTVLLAGARAGIRIQGECVGIAVSDAMQRVRRRSCTPAADRAKQLRMSKRNFLTLRGAAESRLINGIREGLRRYLAACGYNDRNIELQDKNHDHEHRAAA